MMTELEYEATQLKIERENEEKLKHYPILEKQLDIANKALDELRKENEAFEELATNLEKDCERLQKQLDIATSYLDVIYGLRGGECFNCVEFARRARKKIQELNK